MTKMTIEDVRDKLISFRIRAFADTACEIAKNPEYDSFTFIEKLALCACAEDDARKDRRIAKYNKAARFLDPMACIEDITYLPDRTLKRDTVARLAECGYIKDGRNIIVTAATGSGKSYLVQALGNAACRRGYKVRYARHSDICRDLSIARKNDEYYELIAELTDVDLLILDDLFLEEESGMYATDLLEIITHREASKSSIIIASQLPPEQWHLRVSTKIIADSILDRIVHNAHEILIDGPNMRKHFADVPELP